VVRYFDNNLLYFLFNNAAILFYGPAQDSIASSAAANTPSSQMASNAVFDEFAIL
jgi:hypothetical protein